MVGIEGVGEAVSGGMLARAVEPAAGESIREPEGNCLNCGAELVGPYCHRCGQKGHVHRTLSAFWHDLLHGVLHFEGKVWRTLPLLAWRPGELTRRYIDGERARFVSPIALFLFSVFLMFAVFSTVGGPFVSDTSAQAVGEARQDMQREANNLRRGAARLERQRRALAASGRPTEAVDAALADIRREQAALDTARRIVATPSASPAATDGAAVELDRLDINTGWPPFDRAAAKAAENPSLLAYKLQTNAYKFSWALIPISVPFVWLLFLWRRRFKAYDHTVFVTYSLAFMTLLVVALSLFRPILGGGGLAGMALTFIPPLHMYRQLRGSYGLSRFSAIWRTLLLLLFALLAGTLFFLLLLALGLLG